MIIDICPSQCTCILGEAHRFRFCLKQFQEDGRQRRNPSLTKATCCLVLSKAIHGPTPLEKLLHLDDRDRTRIQNAHHQVG